MIKSLQALQALQGGHSTSLSRHSRLLRTNKRTRSSWPKNGQLHVITLLTGEITYCAELLVLIRIQSATFLTRGGPTNSSGGGFWAGILQRGGGGRVQIRGNSDQQKKLREALRGGGGGVDPLTRPPPLGSATANHQGSSSPTGPMADVDI